jgi:hypothetical protein
LGVEITILPCKKLFRSLQKIQPDFEEEAKAYAGLWNQGKKIIIPPKMWQSTNICEPQQQNFNHGKIQDIKLCTELSVIQPPVDNYKIKV